MSEIKDGGPAFPMPANEYGENGPNWGMTLRDYFAAKALQGLLYDTPGYEVAEGRDVRDQIAFDAYEYADAMLRARGES